MGNTIDFMWAMKLPVENNYEGVEASHRVKQGIN